MALQKVPKEKRWLLALRVPGASQTWEKGLFPHLPPTIPISHFRQLPMSAVAWQTLHLAQHLSNSHPAPPGCVVSPPWPLAPVYLTGKIFFYLTASSYCWNTQIQSLSFLAHDSLHMYSTWAWCYYLCQAPPDVYNSGKTDWLKELMDCYY